MKVHETRVKSSPNEGLGPKIHWNIRYTAVAQAIRRVRRQIHRDKAWRQRIDAVSEQLSKMKM
ncbi:MAG: hypothetical protein KA191_08935 [Verrucomicrobia bacterium]|nr:hypothetical protein [Verrucomicrobiota bacterium]MDI9380985.1 hypothetical protein [Verrucomicrobiota bacterium]NMD21722.1 hypothetical protein [Verrucomicrobiota bacterium]HOA60432.1 hypothetical protein [Verrucomicrobiota bacterium]HOR71165.1 hypothetical protein [Verrucomicrobiota bacterium]